MKIATSLLAIAASASAFAPAPESTRISTVVSETKADLEILGNSLNPVVNYFDPVHLADGDFYGMGEESTIGFLRQAEIKHSRVAMMAFVGYCVQSNFRWPWAMTTAGDAFPSTDLSPEQQWDAIPTAAKWQIILLVGAFEIWDESKGLRDEGSHYMKGGRPGDYPTFARFREDVHFALDLYDPFGFNKNMPEAKKEKRLLIEINNGRLAMLGIFGFLAADKIPGSVPLLKGIAMPYDGNPMVPFEGDFTLGW